MLSKEKMAVAMGAVRDQLVAVVGAHEREEHGGKACMGNRADCVAFLAHCLGLTVEHWAYAGKLLAQYDAECDSRSCGHDVDRDFPP